VVDARACDRGPRHARRPFASWAALPVNFRGDRPGPVVLWPIFRFTNTIAGIAAAAARQWESAEDHFQIAMRQAESFPHMLEQTEMPRFHAMMLINRAGPGDREKARALLGEALASYTRIGMPRHIEIARRLLD
jgi:hypothetical protein